MKIARFFGIIFAIAGVVLMIGTAGLCLLSLDAPTQVAQVPQGALDCAQEVMDAIAAGDFTAASARMYGQPDLGAGQEASDPETQKLWQAFRRSVAYEFQGACYVTDTGFARKARVSALEVAPITDKVSTYAGELLNERIEAATEMADLYDEAGEFRADLIDQVMTQALDMALAEGAGMETVDVTLGLVFRDGIWWAVPDQALLMLLGGI